MARKSETIRSEWDKISIASERLSLRTHRCAMWTLEHFKSCGDTSLMTYACETLRGKGAHRRALIQWFEKFGRCKQQTNGIFNKKPKADHTTIDIDRANTSPYYADDDAMGKTAVDAKTFDIFSLLASALKKMEEVEAEYATKPEAFKKPPVILPEAETNVIRLMLDQHNLVKDLDKPQPKADKTIFAGHHTTRESKRQTGAGLPSSQALAS